jgi:hypothetical protein
VDRQVVGDLDVPHESNIHSIPDSFDTGAPRRRGPATSGQIQAARFFKGWRMIGIVPLDVMADGVANASSGWPVWLTLTSGGPNSGDTAFVNYLGGTASILLAVFTMAIIIHVVQRSYRSPAASPDPSRTPLGAAT